MNILIVGPGAMGCLFTARLLRAGYNVALLDYLPERAEKISRQGIMVEGISGEYGSPVSIFTDKVPFSPDIVLICVKANKTREAATAVSKMTHSDTAIVTLQNGVGNIEILKEIFKDNKVFGGVTAEGATLLDWGRIRHAGQGDTVIGPEGIGSNILKDLVMAFLKAGFQTKAAENVDDLLWGKLIINVGINALTAITRLKNGMLPRFEGTRIILEQAVEEAVHVAEAKKINLPYPDPIKRVKEVCDLTAGNIASMLQDVLKEKVTEVDFINGAIVKEGELMNIPTPVNFTLTSLIHAIQESYPERIA